jgi:hypothetical protein
MNPILVVLLSTFFLSLIGITVRAAIARSYATPIVALAVAVAGTIVGGMFGPDMGLSMYGAAFASVVSVVAVFGYNAHRRAHLLKLKETASALQGYVLRFFDTIDMDKDQLITLNDTYRFLEARVLPVDAVQTELINIMDRNMCLIGHVIGTGAFVGSAIGGAHVYNIYGVSRDDILSWPERAARDYNQEFA